VSRSVQRNNADALQALTNDLGSDYSQLLNIVLKDTLEGEDFVTALMGFLEKK